MSGDPSIRHIPALDGLRGAALVGVLLFHGGHLTGGFLGVDLFFVLSGFLITSLLLVEAGSSRDARIRLGAFWARRARRLLPAVGGLLVGVAVYAVVFAQPTELAQIRGDALATLYYGANWRAVGATRDYWSLFSAPSPLQHTWSLAIEEQFYLVWPIVFVGLLAWRGRAVAATVFSVATIGALASAAAMWLSFDPGSTARAYYGTDTRAAGILLGAALAALLRWRGSCRGRPARIGLEAASLVALAGLVVAWTRLDGQSAVLYRGGLFACGLAAVVVISAAVHPVPGPIARVLSWRPLCLLGLVSYGAYLWHWPVYVVLDPVRTGLSEWWLLGVRVIVTLAFAVASFVVIERPVRRGAGSPRRWRVAVPALASGAVVMLVVATMGARSAQLAGRDPSVSSSVLLAARRPPGVTRVLVAGDSVAMTLTPGLQLAAAAHDLEIVSAAAEACGPDGRRQQFGGSTGWGVMLPEIEGASRGCVSTSALVERFHPDVVLGIDSGVWSLGDGLETFRANRWLGTLVPAPPGVLRIWATIACVGSSREVADSRFADRLPGANAILRELAGAIPRTAIIELGAHVCPTGSYQEGLGRVPALRPDGLHYGPEGSKLVGRWLAGEIARIVESRR